MINSTVYSYSGRVFQVEDFEILDIDIGTRPTPGSARLKDGTWIMVVCHPEKPDRWAELVEQAR